MAINYTRCAWSRISFNSLEEDWDIYAISDFGYTYAYILKMVAVNGREATSKKSNDNGPRNIAKCWKIMCCDPPFLDNKFPNGLSELEWISHLFYSLFHFKNTHQLPFADCIAFSLVFFYPDYFIWLCDRTLDLRNIKQLRYRIVMSTNMKSRGIYIRTIFYQSLTALGHYYSLMISSERLN